MYFYLCVCVCVYKHIFSQSVLTHSFSFLFYIFVFCFEITYVTFALEFRERAKVAQRSRFMYVDVLIFPLNSAYNV